MWLCERKARRQAKGRPRNRNCLQGVEIMKLEEEEEQREGVLLFDIDILFALPVGLGEEKMWEMTWCDFISIHLSFFFSFYFPLIFSLSFFQWKTKQSEYIF